MQKKNCKIKQGFRGQGIKGSRVSSPLILQSAPMLLNRVNPQSAISLHEYCGLFGIYGHREAARLTYLGLYSLQHRGQESAGIVSSEAQKMYHHLGMGLVADVFNLEILNRLKGSRAIGHVRYSTAGTSELRNAQPIVVDYTHGSLAIAHNGNLSNALELREKLEKQGSIFQTGSDSEVVLHLLARQNGRPLAEALKISLKQVEGAYSLVLLNNKEMVAVRDPLGVRPLSIGKLGKGYVAASETCAFDLIGAKYLRDVQPGEIVVFNEKGLRSLRMDFTPKCAGKNCPASAFCIFEYIYFSRPDSHVFGKSVYLVRKELGRQLARECHRDADLVFPVPDSASVAAVGYAEASGIPYGIGLVRNHYIGRTFIEPEQSIRDFGAKIKYNAVREAIRGKRLIVVDDSIVRGTTSRKLVRMMRQAGAKEIHLRISSPPITHPCYYGIDTPTREELIAAQKKLKEIEKYLDVDSLHYLSLEGLLQATGRESKVFCSACFTGKYPI